MNIDFEHYLANYQTQKLALNFFDMNCWIDFFDTERFHEIDTLEKLNSWLQDKKITRAIMTNAESIIYDPYIGNDHLELLLAAHKNLYGGLVLTPDLLYNGIDMDIYIKGKIKHQFVMARFFPKKYYHSMADFAVGEILSYLQMIRFPVVLWHGEVSWEDIDSLCRRYPDLPLILEGNPTKLLYYNRNYIALLKTHKNLYIETHGLIQFKELDSLVSAFGAEKLIYGSYSPYNEPDISMANICFAQMDTSSKRKIAFENMDALISQIIA